MANEEIKDEPEVAKNDPEVSPAPLGCIVALSIIPALIAFPKVGLVITVALGVVVLVAIAFSGLHKDWDSEPDWKPPIQEKPAIDNSLTLDDVAAFYKKHNEFFSWVIALSVLIGYPLGLLTYIVIIGSPSLFEALGIFCAFAVFIIGGAKDMLNTACLGSALTLLSSTVLAVVFQYTTGYFSIWRLVIYLIPVASAAASLWLIFKDAEDTRLRLEVRRLNTRINWSGSRI